MPNNKELREEFYKEVQTGHLDTACDLDEVKVADWWLSKLEAARFEERKRIVEEISDKVSKMTTMVKDNAPVIKKQNIYRMLSKIINMEKHEKDL